MINGFSVSSMVKKVFRSDETRQDLVDLKPETVNSDLAAQLAGLI